MSVSCVLCRVSLRAGCVSVMCRVSGPCVLVSSVAEGGVCQCRVSCVECR